MPDMRPDGTGSKITKGGKTYYRVRVQIRDEYGRKKIKGFERKTLIDAQNAAARFLAKNGRTFKSEPCGTMQDLFQRVELAVWSDTSDKNLADCKMYRKLWESHIGELPVDGIETPMLTKILGLMCQKKSKSFIDKAVRTITQAFAYAKSDLGWIESNPGEGIRKPKAAGKQITYQDVTREEYNKMLGLADDKCRLLIRLIGECGMRPSEAERVRPEHLFSAHDYWMVTIPKSKTTAGIRSVPVPDTLAREIEAHAGKGWEGITDPKDHLRHWWRANSKTRLYDLRGWCADEWRRKGVNDQVRSYLLGHTNPQFTQRVYEDLTAKDTLEMFGLSVGNKGGTE
jgi:integrase